VNALYLYGSTGIFRANGGAGGTSGGGAGGRIAVVALGAMSFDGSFEAYGGTGRNAGGAGTVFIRDQTVTPVRTMLRIANNGRDGVTPLVGASVQSYDTVHLIGSAVLRLPSSQDLTITSLVGDRTGLFSMPSASRLFLTTFSGARCKCSFDVGTGSVVNFLPSYVVIDSTRNPILQLNGGTLNGDRVTLGSSAVFRALGSSVLNVRTLEVGKGSTLDISTQSTVGYQSTPGNYIFNDLIVQDQSNLLFQLGTFVLRANNFIMGAQSRLYSAATAKNFTFITSYSYIQSGAVIDASNGGLTAGLGAPGANSGAGYGGFGSGPSAGTSYGSQFTPSDFGSGVSGAPGGGIISFSVVGGTFALNGELSVDGSSGTTGAGSGGSILITATTVRGHGYAHANGGSVTNTGAGASGGRLAVIADDQTQFIGTLNAIGGGNSGNAGACGTVYRQQLLYGIPDKSIFVDNGGLITTAPCVLQNFDSGSYIIDSLTVQRSSRVEFAAVPSGITSIFIRKMVGDYTGIVTVKSSQTVYVAASKAALTKPFEIPCTFIVNNGGELVLPPRVSIPATQTQPSLRMDGIINGVNLLTAAAGSSIVFGETARTASGDGAGVYTFIDPQATLTLLQLSVGNGATVTLERSLAASTAFSLQTLALVVASGGVLSSPFVSITSSSVTTGYSGSITSASLGYTAGQGRGTGSGSTGGSFGGIGGTGPSSAAASPIGCHLNANELGSGGGGSAGGRGGGRITISTTTLRNDGSITSSGGDATSSTVAGGGGAGGSVQITTSSMTGTGWVISRGGSAYSSALGGGGSGGRWW